MARFQILNLPADGQPFALVIDQINDTGAMVEIIKASDAAAQIGARTVFAFEETIEIVGQGSGSASAAPTAGHVEWYSEIGAVSAGSTVDWEAAATRNGELYSACENQRDDLREAITRVRNLPAEPQAEDAQHPWSECYKLGYRHAHAAAQRAIDNPPTEAGSS